MAIYKENLIINRPSYFGGGNWNLFNLNHITVILGRNGSGKSQLLRLIRDQDTTNTHYATPERGGEISYDPNQAFQELDFTQRANKRRSNFHPSYRQEVISRVGTYLQTRGKRRGKNPVPVDPMVIEDLLSEFLPNFQIIIPENEPKPVKIIRRVPEEQEVSSINMLSSGESEIITLALDILTISAIWELEEKDIRILLIDEPDTHLHPELQQHFAKFIVKVMEMFKLQIIVATHSTTLLASLGQYGSEKVSIIYLSNSSEEQRATKFDKYSQVLSTCLGGHALMGPLFNTPLVLVEGEDDYDVWSTAARCHKLKIAVIPCNGSEIANYKRKLEQIFQAMLENPPSSPIGYVIRDRDETVPNDGASNDCYIKVLRLNCREVENLYLSDEVLVNIGTDWEKVKKKLQQEAKNYGTKKEKIEKVANCDDRRDIDLKEIMLEIQQIIDPKNVNWRIRIGHVLGHEKPAGQLADFLGSEIVSTFWE